MISWGDAAAGGDSSAVADQLQADVVGFADPFHDDMLRQLSAQDWLDFDGDTLVNPLSDHLVLPLPSISNRLRSLDRGGWMRNALISMAMPLWARWIRRFCCASVSAPSRCSSDPRPAGGASRDRGLAAADGLGDSLVFRESPAPATPAAEPGSDQGCCRREEKDPPSTRHRGRCRTHAEEPKQDPRAPSRRFRPDPAPLPQG